MLVSAYRHQDNDTTARKRAQLQRHKPELATLLTGVPDGTKHLTPAHAVIDDAPHVLEAERQHNPTTVIVGIDQPYNQPTRGFDVRVYDIAQRGWGTLALLMAGLRHGHVVH